MPVFISYRHSDRFLALEIHEKLKNRNISSYLDVFDEESKTTDDISRVITDRINQCTHLIAIMTHTTAKSWWVPFEIGEATITNKMISSYRSGIQELPEYLNKWPQMLEFADLEIFISNYNKSYTSLGMESHSRSTILDSALDKSHADEFHANMKKALKRDVIY